MNKDQIKKAFETAEPFIPVWNVWAIIREEIKARKRREQFDIEFEMMRKYGQLLSHGYVPRRYRSIEGHDEQLGAIVEDLIVNNQFYDYIFADEIANGFDKTEQAILDSTEEHNDETV